MSTTPPTNPPTTSVKPCPPSAGWCCYEADDVLLLLSTTQVVLDSTFNFSAKTCYIYAEDIIISTANLSLPGKNLGIFCNQLTLGLPKVTIDTSGSTGAAGTAVIQGPGPAGDPGNPGGNIWVYVEDLTDELLSGLICCANGGDGGRGGATTDVTSPPPSGGRGGAGGVGGNVNIFYGSVAINLALVIAQIANQAWPAQVSQAQASLIPACISLEPSFSGDIVTESNATLSLYSAYCTAAQALVAALGLLTTAQHNITLPQPSKQTLQDATACSSALSKVLASINAPTQTQVGTTTSLNTLTAQINQWLGEGGGTALETQIDASLVSVASTMVVPTENGLLPCLQNIGVGLEVILMQDQTSTQYLMCSAKAGVPGIGGSSGTPQTPPGATGSAGTAGTCTSISLAFNGRPADLSVTQVCAFPEQCQMLLNEANRLFFTNDPSNILSAAQLYTRLTQRLAFVPTMTSTSTSTSPQGSKISPLAAAYNTFESMQLTISSMTTLQSVYSQAKAGLNNITLNEDMFGHNSIWAPRLSYDFYSGQANQLLAFLKTVESTTSAYYTALQQESSAQQSLQASIQNSQDAYNEAEERISLIGGPNGVLQMSGAKINLFTPILAEQRAAIQTSMAKVEWDIQNKLNLSVQSVLNAFASLAIAPTKVNAAAQLANLTYQAFTTVDNTQGVPVNKDYIISQLSSCGDTLESLNESFTTAADGTIDVDDPGALKIMTDVSNIESLVSQYKSAIPAADSEALDAQLDQYVDTINERNSAVIAYNSALQLLNQALSDAQYYSNQNQTLGQQVLQLNPNLPAIYFWLQNMEQGLQLDIMQRLNYEARAICFWGLSNTFSFSQPGPLQGYVDLENNQLALQEKFGDCLTQYASSLWSTWPTQNDPNSMGLIYQLAPNELTTLLTPQADPNPPAGASKTSTYGVFLTFDPKTSALFAGKANVRLSQIRFWLPGAAVTPDVENRQLLTVEIEQMGTETLLSPSRTSYTFTHDAVGLQFIYNTAGVGSIQDCNTKLVFSTESIEQDYTGGPVTTNSTAALGPLSTWRIQIHQSENPGLDLTNVKGAYMEFWGRNMPFSFSSPRPEQNKTRCVVA